MSNSAGGRKIGVVTGAAAGIGAAIAKKAAARLDNVILLDIDLFRAQEVCEEINAIFPRKTFAYECDVGDAENVRSCINHVIHAIGTPNILINNAGVGGPFHRIDEVSDEEWLMIINTNLKSVFNLCRILLPLMKQQSYGRIVNIASVQGYLGAALSSTYVASEHAVIGYTRAIAAEWGQYNITCNAVCPGYVDTTQGVQIEKIKAHRQKVIDKTPVGRIASSQEIANAVMFFLEVGSAFVNGTILTVDGGLTCHTGVT